MNGQQSQKKYLSTITQPRSDMQEWCTQLTLFTESRIEKCVILRLPSSYMHRIKVLFILLQVPADASR